MKSFERCTTTRSRKFKPFLAECRAAGITDKTTVTDAWHYLQRCENWINDEYHVAIDKQCEHGFGEIEVWHLSIKRHDRETIGDWRIKQEIKNLIVGEECDAFELYPKESRLVDTANQYHLYAFPSGHTVPVGWTLRCVTDDPHFGKAKQRPRE